MKLDTYISGLQGCVARDFEKFVSRYTVMDYESIPVQVAYDLPRPNVHAERYEQHMLSATVNLDYALDCVNPYTDEPVDYPEALVALDEALQDLSRATMFARQAGGMSEQADAAYLYKQCIEPAKVAICERMPG